MQMFRHCEPLLPVKGGNAPEMKLTDASQGPDNRPL